MTIAHAPGRGAHRAPPTWFLRLAPLTVGLLGLSVQLFGYWQGRHDRAGALPLFYAGLIIMATPCVWVLVGRDASSRRRLATGCLLSMLLYLSYFLSSPLLATRFDETLHVSTLMSLVRGDGLFAPNGMLPVSPLYPGLELATAGVRWLTGFPTVACQALVVAAARLLLITMLFLLARRYSGSARVGGLVVLGYCASTQFYFFNAQFAYQTLAITLLVGIAFLIERLLRARRAPTASDLALLMAVSAALAITHHLTSWIAAGLGWLGAAVAFVLGRRDDARTVAIAVAPITVAAAAWTIVVGDQLAGYLGPLFSRAQQQLSAIVGGGAGPRAVFVDQSGAPTPLWERAVMVASILIWLGLLAAACWQAWRERRIRWPIVLAAATYPALLATKVAPTASEIADRASTFVFLIIAFIVARWAVRRLDGWPQWTNTAVALVLLVGGLLLGGGPDWGRVPGPYLPGAQQRSIDETSVAAARWAGKHFPDDSLFAADTTMNRLIPNFADAQPVTAIDDRANVSTIFYSPTVDRRELALIRDQHIDFVVVDTRLADQKPRIGTFYESTSEFGTSWLGPAQLEKFNATPGFVKVLDGPVQIFDVRSISGTAAPWADRTDPVTPNSPVPWQAPIAAVIMLAALPLLRRRRMPAERLVLLGLGAIGVLIVLGLLGVAVGFPT